MKIPGALVSGILAVAVGCSGPDRGQDSELDQVLVDVTVIDGTGAAPRAGQTVEIREGRITAIRPAAPGDNATLDVAGSFVTPGLIDAHVHLTIFPAVTDTASLEAFLDQDLPEILRGFLRNGVTTVRSTGDYWPWIGSVRDLIAAGELEGPRLLAAGPVLTYTGAHPASTVCEGNPFCRSAVVAEVGSPEDARATVERLAREGVDFIKVVSDSLFAPVQIPGEVMAAVIDQSHEEGLEAVGHVLEAEFIRRAARAGLDGFVHPTFFPLSPDDARELASVLVQHGTPVTTTVSASLLFSGVPVDVALQPGSELHERLVTSARPLATMAEEGVRVAVGTDWSPSAPGGSNPNLRPGAVTLTEMEILGWAGMSAGEILVAATSNAARALRLDSELGTLTVGKLADLVVYPADPSVDITALRDPSHVIMGGKLVRP